jgi:cell division protein FtsL
LDIHNREYISSKRLQIKQDLKDTNKKIFSLEKRKEKLEKEKRDLSFNELIYDTLLMNWK